MLNFIKSLFKKTEKVEPISPAPKSVYDLYREYLLKCESSSTETIKSFFNQIYQRLAEEQCSIDIRMLLAHTMGYYRLESTSTLIDNFKTTDKEITILFKKILTNDSVTRNKESYALFDNFIISMLREDICSENFIELIFLHFYHENHIILINDNSNEIIFNINNAKYIFNDSRFHVPLDLSANYYEQINIRIKDMKNIDFILKKKWIFNLLDLFRDSNINISYKDYQLIFSSNLSIDNIICLIEWFQMNHNLLPLSFVKSKQYIGKEYVSVKEYLHDMKNINPSWHCGRLYLPDFVITNLKNSESIKELTLNYSNAYNKRLEKIIYNEFGENFYYFKELELLKHLGLSADQLCNFIEQPILQLKKKEMIQKNNVRSFHLLSEYYSIERIFLLMQNFKNCEDSFWYIEHTLEMIAIVNQYNSATTEDQRIKQLLRKPKSFKELHDYLSKLTNQLKQQNYNLYQDFLLPLEKWDDTELSIRVPLKNHDLVEIGSELYICVGSGGYGQKILNKTSNIITVFHKGELSYCIEIDKYFKVHEAKAKFNNQVPKGHYKKIVEQIYRKRDECLNR